MWGMFAIKSFLQLIQALKEKASQPHKQRWLRISAYFAVAVFILTIAIHLTVRLYYWPQINQKKEDFEKLLGQQLQLSVKVESIQTSWDIFWPSFAIKNIELRKLNEASAIALKIPEVEGTVSWDSLWFRKPMFRSLLIKDATIQVERDQQGNWNIAGIDINANSAGHDVGNWIFEQDRIQISNSKIVWDDQRYGNHTHQFQIHKLDLESHLFRHAIELSASTPFSKNLVGLNAQFRHSIFGNAGNWLDWHGQFNWDIQEFEVAKIHQIIELPFKIKDGKISSQGSTDLSGGVAEKTKALLEVQQLHIDWRRLKQELKIAYAQSEINQFLNGQKMTVATPLLQWKVKAQSPLEELKNIAIYWKKAKSISAIEHAGIQAEKIEVSLLEELLNQFPLPQDFHQFNQRFQASGKIRDLDISWHKESKKLPFDIQLPWQKNASYRVGMAFDDINITPYQKNDYSIRNLSGKIQASELGGEIHLGSTHTQLNLLDLTEKSDLYFQEIKGKIHWQRQEKYWSVSAKNLALQNEDLKLKANGQYTHPLKDKKDKDHLKLSLEIDEANIAGITAYFPKAMSADARNYIRSNLKSGVVRQGKLEIDGHPQWLPFNDKNIGVFTLHLPVSEVRYSPAPADPQQKGLWSDFYGLRGLIKMNRGEFEVLAEKASFEQIQLSNTRAYTKDITAKDTHLEIQGKASGPTQDLLNYFAKSPVGQRLYSQWQEFQISGNAELLIKLDIPLAKSIDTRVEGELALKANELLYNKQLAVKNINGTVVFSEEQILAKKLGFDVWGGHITASIPTQLPWQKAQRTKLSGTIQSQELLDYLSSSSQTEEKNIIKQLDGPIQVEGFFNAGSKGYKLDLGLDLKQFQSRLPQPLSKKTGQGLTGQFVLQGNKDTDVFENKGQLVLGKLIDMKLAWAEQKALRGSIGINSPVNLPKQGFTTNIILNTLNLDEWQNWYEKTIKTNAPTKSANPSAPAIDTISAYVDRLIVADREFKDVAVLATHEKDQWHASINSELAVGLVQWKSAQIGLPQGKLTARLQKLNIQNESQGDTLTRGINQRMQKIPALDIEADALIFNGKPYGKMSLLASNDKNDWRIDRLYLKTPVAELQATGKWALPKAGIKDDRGSTILNFDLDIDNAGELLKNLGFPSTVDKGAGKLVGSISWSNAPYSFDLKSLNGNLSLDLIKGTVLQVEPGVARLLGVLSFQGLNRLATLDIGGVLKPIVSQGMPFDRITSKGMIQNGIAQIQDLSLRSPQGNVRLSGRANLLNETQDIRITVLPALNAGSASVAYTFVNPIIGLSTLLGQYLIADPVSKLFQLDYLIQGGWDKPEIIALDSKGQPINEAQLKDIRDKSLLKQQNSPSKK